MIGDSSTHIKTQQQQQLANDDNNNNNKRKRDNLHNLVFATIRNASANSIKNYSKMTTSNTDGYSTTTTTISKILNNYKLNPTLSTTNDSIRLKYNNTTNTTNNYIANAKVEVMKPLNISNSTVS